jgi:hypothetical protein
MPVAIIITVVFYYYYNTGASLFDNLAALSLASLGLPFSLVALIRLGSTAWHNMSQALTRRCHLANSQRGC